MFDKSLSRTDSVRKPAPTITKLNGTSSGSARRRICRGHAFLVWTLGVSLLFTTALPAATKGASTSSISPTSAAYSSNGGSGSVSVTTGSGTRWTASSGASWITIKTGASGKGNGTVTYSVLANTATSQRTGTMTIAGQAFTVTESGVSCSYTINPASGSFAASGGSGSVSVTAGAGCTWSASSGASWVTITAGASGSGNGTVSFSVAANTSTSSRNGTLTIAGQAYTVSQAAASCNYAISPTSGSFTSAAGSGSVNVTAGAGCTWSASSGASWITITAGASGSGNGTVSYSVAANTSASSRTGTLTIAGQSFTVTQAGTSCTYAISPTSGSFPSTGGSGSVNVTAGAGCAWSATSGVSWIAITAGASGSGNGTVSYTVAQNTSPSPLSGTMTIAGQTFTVSQAASSSGGSLAGYWTFDTTNISGTTAMDISGNRNDGTLAGSTLPTTVSGRIGQAVYLDGVSDVVTAPDSASLNLTGPFTVAAWVNVATPPASGKYPSVIAKLNTPGSYYGYGMLWSSGIRGIIGPGAPSWYQTDPYTPVAGVWNHYVTVFDGTNLKFYVNGALFSQVAASAPGSTAGIPVKMGPHYSDPGNYGYLNATLDDSRIYSRALSDSDVAALYNGAGSCTFAISPTSNSVAASGGSGSVNVTAGAGCAWSATSGASWITITGGASSSGNGTVSYSVTQNTSTSSRTGTMTIAGQTFTVTQAAGSSGASLAGYWTFDSTNVSGATSIDISGYGNNGTLSGTTVPSVASGRIGQGIYLDGVSQVATVPDSASLNLTGPFTVAAWVNVATLPASGKYPSVIAKLNTPGNFYGYGMLWSSGVRGIIGPGAPSWYQTDPYTPAAGVWNHYVTVFDGTNLKFYVNGALYSQVAASAPGSTAGIPVKMGPHYSDPGNYGYLNATLDDSRIYNGALSDSDVAALYNSAGSCTFSISPTGNSLSSAGGSGTVSVTAGTGCGWTASSGTSWITITGGASGSGNGTVSYSVAANTGSSLRTGTMTIAGQTFSVSEAGISCSYAISPNNASFNSSGGSGGVNVTAGSGCGWTASSGAAWITITGGASGSGNGTVSYSVAPNTGATTLTGTMTIAGQTFTVTETAPCSFTLSPTSASSPATGGSGSVSVTAINGSCVWTASSGVSWITITAGSTGTGNGTVSYSVAANTTSSARSGTMTIGLQTFTVNQAVDTTMPTVSLTAPGNGSTVSGSIAVSASASDPVGIGRVDFYRDGTTLVGSATTSPYSVTDDTTIVNNGPHNYSAKAYDNAGNATTSSSSAVTVTNSTTPPGGQVQWVRDMVAGLQILPGGVATDRSNNSVVAGGFVTSGDFGSGPLSSAGSLDIFIAKYTSQGALVWAKTFGNTGDDRAFAVATDSQGNIIVTGYFEKTVNFGGVTLTANDPSQVGQPDIFVVKYSPSGTLLWAKQFGGSSYDVGQGVAVDGSDNVFLAAIFTGTVDFGGTILTSVGGSSDVALVKLAGATGGTIWAKGIGGSAYDSPSSVAVDRSGDVLVAGQAGGPINFGGGSTAGGGFIAKYSGVDGSYRWALILTAGPNAVATDPVTGNVFATGTFSGSVDLGGGSLATPFGGNGGFFVAAYGPSGSYLWAQVYGANGDGGNAIAVDSSGNLAVTGIASGLINLEGATSGSGWFAVNFTTAGGFRWAKRAGGQSSGTGVTYDSLGHMLCTGSFQGTLDFGGIAPTAKGYQDGFLVQYTK